MPARTPAGKSCSSTGSRWRASFRARAPGYNYGRDSAITINDLPFAVSLRESRADADPPPGSDGAAMMDFVKAAGLTFPPMGRPLRMVHTAKPGARQELMVIYLESKADGQGRSDVRRRLQAGQAGASLRRLPLSQGGHFTPA